MNRRRTWRLGSNVDLRSHLDTVLDDESADVHGGQQHKHEGEAEGNCPKVEVILLDVGAERKVIFLIAVEAFTVVD